MAVLIDGLKYLYIAKMRREKSCEVLFRFEFIFVVRKHFLAVGLLYDRKSRKNSGRSQSPLDVSHQVADFGFGKMLDRSIPYDVVEGPFRHLRPNVCEPIDDIFGAEMSIGEGDGLGVEIDRHHGADAGAVKKVRVETIAATQFEGRASRFQGKKREHAAFHPMWGALGPPHRVKSDLGIKELRTRVCPPLC